ncbi:hypothetical protein PTTG_03545 [Puccinia triticina 1-1 BBBD Race 1]|uniref:RRM domain-containing protein n=1 Tax=Puccinia triticina (isolate 1-1 / race 1 (BBBD)) TaxID=630390 RepID=A0A0C4ERX5_PUCT1|nr:hypothetical protein PTTG_03545 [Puccinia triticina 1-1 BBBD Race 1]WAR63086.1 hypothetical protein PtB15_18B168 [Puccinia triticina]
MATSHNDAAPNGTDGVAAITDALEATTIQELGRKVFVGNLSFATKDDQLRDVFNTHGQISDVQIIHRGTRSMGYGFVTFATCEEAEKAVAATDKTEIDGRAINVEIAKPAPGTPGGPVPRAAARAGKASKARPTNGDAKASDQDPDAQTDDPSPTGSKAKRSGNGAGRGRSRRGRARRPAGEPRPEASGDDNGAVTDASTHNEEERASKPRSTRTRSRRGKAPVAAASVDGVKRERRPRRKGPPEGEPSQTSLFVANLPFDVTDEKLKEFFASYEVVSAHVVSRRYGSSTGRSKGFGFVEFANEENQLKALEEIQGKEMDGRALHVKIAINEAKKDAEEAADKDTGAPASVPAEPAAA